MMCDRRRGTPLETATGLRLDVRTAGAEECTWSSYVCSAAATDLLCSKPLPLGWDFSIISGVGEDHVLRDLVERSA